MSSDKAEDPRSLKEGILEKSGSRIADISVASILNPQETEVDDEEKAFPDGEDPSRDIPSAEVGMTFDGQSNSGSANLNPFIKRRLAQIARRMKKKPEAGTDEEDSGEPSP